MNNEPPTAEQINALLPQTQCGLCSYPGCRPYAEAIVQGAAINQCLMGGVPTLEALGKLCQQDVSALIPAMNTQAKPASKVVIKEEACIGCTKCIQACPVDAIIGTAKHLHSILTDLCTGCDLCIPLCPVDCIEVVAVTSPSAEQRLVNAQRAEQRFAAHEQRLANLAKQKATQYSRAKQPTTARKAEIAQILARAKPR